jgi:DUF917 family protein
MPTRQLTTLAEIEDFVHGLVLFGTGGGGGPADQAIARLRTAMESGVPVGWTDIDDLPDETWTFSVAGVGGRAPAEGPDAGLLRRTGLVQPAFTDFKEIQLAAARTLAELHGVQLGAVIPVELGSGNTVTPLLVAAELGIPLVDGDYCGRAKPEIQQSTLEIEGRGVWPLVFIDRWGDVVHIPTAISTAMVDRIGRHLCSAALGGIAVARALLPASEARRAIVRGSCESAYQMGRVISAARAGGHDVVASVVDHLGGARIFDGTIDGTDEDPESGYQFHVCTHRLRGHERKSGQMAEIWVKNEHHIVWVDGTPRAMSPDIIAVLERGTGRPLTNHEITEGRQVSVIAAPPLDARWRSAAGIDLLGPRAFGFDFDYRPVEELAV